MAGEAVSVPQKEPESLPRAIPEQQANGHSVWATEQQEPCFVHGHLEAVEKSRVLRGRQAWRRLQGALAAGVGVGGRWPLVLRNSCCSLGWEVHDIVWVSDCSLVNWDQS